MRERLTAAVSGGVFVGVLAGVEPFGGQLVRERVAQLELLAVGAGQLVGQRVEVQTTCGNR